MSEEQVRTVPRRRSREEAAQLVAEYEASDLSKSEFCRTHSVAVSTLDAYRSGRRQGVREGPARWVAVEVPGAKQPETSAPASGLAVVLTKGRRIEVGRGFDATTLEQLLGLLERG
jgi:transposase-like protein